MLLEASGTQNYVSSLCNYPIIGRAYDLGNNWVNTLDEVGNIFYKIGSAAYEGVKEGIEFGNELIPDMISTAIQIAGVGATACLVIGGVSASTTADSAAITVSVVLFVGTVGGGWIGIVISSAAVYIFIAVLDELEGKDSSASRAAEAQFSAFLESALESESYPESSVAGSSLIIR